jgi:hypothetical protein
MRSGDDDPSWDAWKTVTVPALRGFTAPEIAARSGLHRRTVERHLSGRAVPHPRQRAILTAIAVDLARACLSDWKLPSPREPIACLAAYLDTRERRGVGRYCVLCRAALAGRQREYCSDRCKKHAYRQRQHWLTPRTK